MSVLIIDDRIKAAIEAAIEKARGKPISLEMLKAGAIKIKKHTLTLAERKPGFERPFSEHISFGSYLAAISFEQQPSGLHKHLSISAPKPGTIPTPLVVETIAKEFGLATFPPKDGRIWLEEFEPGHHAVNIIWPD